VPYDLAPVAGGDIEEEDEDEKTEQTDGAVGTAVVLALGTDEGSDDDDGNRQARTERGAHLLRDQRGDPHTGIVPHKMHRRRNNGDGDVEEEDSEHGAEPHQERDHPILVMTMYGDTGNPPTVHVSQAHDFGIITSRLPSHERSEKHVSDDPTPSSPEDNQEIEKSQLAFQSLIAGFLVVGMRRQFPSVQTALLRLVIGASLLDIVVAMGMAVMQLIRVDGVWHRTTLWGGPGRVDDIVGAALLSERGVVLVRVVVLVRNVEGGVRIGMNAQHGRAVVLARNVGHGGDRARRRFLGRAVKKKKGEELERTQSVLWRIYFSTPQARDSYLEPGATMVRPGR